MWDQKADLPQMGLLLSWKLSQGVLLVLSGSSASLSAHALTPLYFRGSSACSIPRHNQPGPSQQQKRRRYGSLGEDSRYPFLENLLFLLTLPFPDKAELKSHGGCSPPAPFRAVLLLPSGEDKALPAASPVFQVATLLSGVPGMDALCLLLPPWQAVVRALSLGCGLGAEAG